MRRVDLDTSELPAIKAMMRLIDWGVDESPRVLGIADLDRIRNSRMMFARKFDSEIDSDIVKAIEAMAG